MENTQSTSRISASRKLLRAGVLLIGAPFLAACAFSGGSDVESIYQIAKDMFSGGRRVTIQEASSTPYASMGVRLGGGSEIMIILATETDSERLWTSASRIAVVTSLDGRIIRTVGFGHDLGSFQLRERTTSAGGATKLVWQADFPSLRKYGVLVTCESAPAGMETIKILGASIRTNRVEERCAADGRSLDWSFRNVYWTDPGSGLAWRSSQHVNPELDPIELEILRPPA